MTLVDKRLKAELAEMARTVPPYANARPRENNIRVWDGVVKGPVGSPYQGGKFNFRMDFPYSYPFAPPKITFKTRIYHSNINTNGFVCLDTLKSSQDGGSWSSGMTIASILICLHQLLGDPNPDDPLMASIAMQFKNNKAEHDRTAKIWTRRYAMPLPKTKN